MAEFIFHAAIGTGSVKRRLAARGVRDGGGTGLLSRLCTPDNWRRASCRRRCSRRPFVVISVKGWRVVSSILNFAANWNKWRRVLRYGKGFRLVDSVRFGLWLAGGIERAAPSRVLVDEVHARG